MIGAFLAITMTVLCPQSKQGGESVYQEDMSIQSDALRTEIANSYHEHPAIYFATKYSVGLGTVYSIASNLGVSSSQRWEGERETIISMYQSGVPVKAIAKELGHFHSNVTKKLREWGIPIRTLTEGRMQYRFDTTYFKSVDSHEKAYWLGFIYADGNVYLNESNHKSVFQVCLAKADNGHLPKLRAALGDTRPLYADKGGERYMINNIQFTRDLIALGVEPRKSLTMTFPTENQVPSQFVSSFLLGYFDGDGSISVKESSWGMTMIGTRPFIEASLDRLETAGLHRTTFKREKRCAGDMGYLTYGGGFYQGQRRLNNPGNRHTLRALYRFLYADSPVWLNRKRAKFEAALTKMYGHDWQRA